MYGRSKPAELEDSDTISVVLGDSHPPMRRISSLPGNCQQMWPNRTCLRVMKARGETSVPVIFEQDRCADDGRPPQSIPEQLVWANLPSGMSWTGQELPVAGLNNSALFSELSGLPPVIIKPGTCGDYNYDNNVNIICCKERANLSNFSKTGEKSHGPGEKRTFCWC